MEQRVKGISFQTVDKVASEMITKGVKPTVRSVIAVTGGKTEIVSKHLRDFFEKRDDEVTRMSEELGSGSIAKLIAKEMQLLIDKRTAHLLEINARQKEQIDEYVELLEENVRESEKIKDEALSNIENAKRENSQKIDKIREELSKLKEIADTKSLEASEIKLLSKNKIEAEQEKSIALLEVANKREEEVIQENNLLREQIRTLSINEAKREIEQKEFDTLKNQFHQLQLSNAQEQTKSVKLLAEKDAISQNIERLEKDNREYKLIEKDFMKAQIELLASQKQINELNSKLSLSEKEINSLKLTVSLKNNH